MQITGDIVWDEQEDAAGGVETLDQREEIAAVRNLTSKVAAERRSADMYPERDLYLDMDIALPFHWETLTGKGHKLSKSSDSQEFEFNMLGASVDTCDHVDRDGISPADDLFYKGQLLPLHLPKRLQMVKKLSSPKHGEKGCSPSVTVSCFFQPTNLKHNSLSNEEGYLSSALVNSRSSSFHSQGSNNFWETDSPGELDSGDSSSSRDSSGSSQDACVPEKQALPRFNDHDAFEKDRGLLQQRDFLGNNNLRSEKSVFSSWLRTPFKWKVFFGLKKNSKSKGDAKIEDSSNDSKLSPFGTKSGRPGASMNMRSRTNSFFSTEQKMGPRKESMSDLEYQGGLFSFPGADTGIGRDRDHDGSASRGRESLNKYLNILKPLNVKVPSRSEQSDAYLRMVDIKAKTTSFSGNLTTPHPKYSMSSGGPSPKAALTKNLSSPKSSFSEQRCRSPTMHSLSGNLRVPSFSRSSKASINASNAVGKAPSPNHSGLLNHSPSTMAELQSAIQGAIAHCKQSQSVDRQ